MYPRCHGHSYTTIPATMTSVGVSFETSGRSSPSIQKCRIQRVPIGFSPHTNFVRVTPPAGALDSVRIGFIWGNINHAQIVPYSIIGQFAFVRVIFACIVKSPSPLVSSYRRQHSRGKVAEDRGWKARQSDWSPKREWYCAQDTYSSIRRNVEQHIKRWHEFVFSPIVK